MWEASSGASSPGSWCLSSRFWSFSEQCHKCSRPDLLTLLGLAFPVYPGFLARFQNCFVTSICMAIWTPVWCSPDHHTCFVCLVQEQQPFVLNGEVTVQWALLSHFDVDSPSFAVPYTCIRLIFFNHSFTHIFKYFPLESSINDNSLLKSWTQQSI